MLTDKAYILYRLPGETEVCRAGFTGEHEGKLCFGDDIRVSPWPYGRQYGVGSDMSVPTGSTPRELYLKSLAQLIEKLKVRGGKTVICRVIAGTFGALDVELMARDYFARFPEMLCFLFYHPATGFWMGASPELLLVVDGDTVSTRALAGTRPAGGSEPWSSKNIDEHCMVIDDIVSTAEAVAGVTATVGETGTFPYGAVEHLCTPVRLDTHGQLPVDSLVASIHPTAAVCGYPRSQALEEIDEVETVPRNCYGGLISIRQGHRMWVYVILRCVHFDDSHWAVYTGSGITPESDALDEWLETQAKAKPLIDILNKYSN